MIQRKKRTTRSACLRQTIFLTLFSYGIHETNTVNYAVYQRTTSFSPLVSWRYQKDEAVTLSFSLFCILLFVSTALSSTFPPYFQYTLREFEWATTRLKKRDVAFFFKFLPTLYPSCVFPSFSGSGADFRKVEKKKKQKVFRNFFVGCSVEKNLWFWVLNEDFINPVKFEKIILKISFFEFIIQLILLFKKEAVFFFFLISSY